MLVRIKGVIEDIKELKGLKKDNTPWEKKVYVVRDNTFKNEKYNTILNVDDLGTREADRIDPKFIFHGNHVVGDEVDLMCWLETNDRGFTNVMYFKTYEEYTRDSNKEQGNVIRPAKTEEEQLIAVDAVNEGDGPTFPF